MRYAFRSPLPFAAAAVAALLAAACSTDEDKAVEVQYKGRLAELDSTRDEANGAFRQWIVPVDTSDTRELRGTCEYTGYIADSLGLEVEDVDPQYTNTMMGNRVKKASELRLEGVRLYLDSALGPKHFYTHYRVDLKCR